MFIETFQTVLVHLYLCSLLLLYALTNISYSADKNMDSAYLLCYNARERFTKRAIIQATSIEEHWDFTMTTPS